VKAELHEQLTDEALIAAFKQSHQNEYFDSIVDRYKNRLYNMAFNLMGNTSEAEELVQETFVRVLRNYNKFQPHGTFARWIFTIIQNLCKDTWRTRRRKQNYEATFSNLLSLHEHEENFSRYSAGSAAISGPEKQVEYAEQKARLLLYLQQLPPNQKEVIILRDIEGHSYKKIALLTGVAIGTVRSRLHYGRLKLREMMK